MGRPSTINPSLTIYGPYLTLGRVGTTTDGFPLILVRNIETGETTTKTTQALRRYIGPLHHQTRHDSVTVGDTYGAWEVVEYLYTNERHQRVYRVRCVHCGDEDIRLSGTILDRLQHEAHPLGGVPWGYVAQHGRLRKAYGSASDYTCSYHGCEKRAEEWSFLGGPYLVDYRYGSGLRYSLDANQYAPCCRIHGWALDTSRNEGRVK